MELFQYVITHNYQFIILFHKSLLGKGKRNETTTPTHAFFNRLPARFTDMRNRNGSP